MAHCIIAGGAESFYSEVQTNSDYAVAKAGNEDYWGMGLTAEAQRFKRRPR
jgi:hypothetical protein